MTDALDRAKKRAADLKVQPDVKRMPPAQKPSVSSAVDAELRRLRQAKAEEAAKKAEPAPDGGKPGQEQERAQEQESVLEDDKDEVGGEGLELLRKLIMEQSNPFVSDDLREAVESRCKELSLDSLLEYREIRQDVEIWPGKLTAVFRTYSHEDYMATLPLLPEDHDRRAQELESVFRLVLSLAAINDTPLPEYTVEGKFDRGNFDKRVEFMTRYPPLFLQMLDANYLWFHRRLVEEIKKGILLKNG